MKNVGIHVLDFNDNIIDFISQSDGALINAEMSMNVEEKTETFDFTIENTRAEKLRERNRIIAQDNNGIFREFIIIHIADNFDGTTEIECNASYLEDLKTAKPIKPGKFEAHTTTQALLKTLADTGWEVSDDTEYGGNRTTSWTSHTNPFDLIYMLCTTYDMVPSFYIELGAHTVEHRYVSITKPKNLFKGKEITKGKDLTGMTRTIDLSEVKTALFAVGPEKEDGSRIETVVVDDEAQEIFGLPNRYIWDVYEPESNDENMTLKRLTTLAKTELNKRNQAAISYEVSSIDIHKYYNDVTVHLRDIVRVKDRDFRPPLYIEAEVIGIKYNWLADESEFTFGNVIEYEETKLREFFTRKLGEITKKINDNISNVNTIVSDVVAGELEYYERKIFKGAEPPEKPQNDTLWYDTSNPDVAVLRRYWDGEWITQTADDVEKIGGLRREQVMYRDLNNSFINLTIQHSKLQNDVYDVLNSEYLVDDDLKANLNQALSDVDNVYQNIKTNLDSMDEDAATIGKLVDTQTLFTVYREKLQTLYKYVTEAKISIDKRLKLLQSQYTDEKFNDAMDKIAQTLPNGRWDSENQQLYADIPNRNEVENLKTTLQEYTDGQINDLSSSLGKEIDSKINTTKEEISASISSVEQKIDGIEVGGRNLLLGTLNYDYGFESKLDSRLEKIGDRLWVKVYNDWLVRQTINTIPNKTYTISFKVKPIADNTKNSIYTPVKEIDTNNNEKYISYQSFDFNKEETFSFNVTTTTEKIRITFLVMNSTYPSFYITDMKVEKGSVATDWTPAPEDLQRQTNQAKTEAEVAAKAYAKAQDELKQTETKAYADGIVSDEEKRAIADAIAKRDEAKEYAEKKAQEAQEAANQNTSNQLEPITTRVTKNEANITELDNQISLMAKSDDVAQKLRDVDGRLTPLETTVKSNKATLDILPTQIESKVSKQDYKTDQNNIVQRLDNADSDRIQLANKIEDRVTITEYNSGIDSIKSTNRNYLQSYYSPHQNIVNGVINGAYSVTLNANRTLNFYFYDRGNGTNPTLEENTDYILKIHESDQNVRMGVFYNKGSDTIVGYTTDNVIRFNTKSYQDIRIVLIPNVDSHFIGKMSLYKGTKELDWSPAPEDIETLAKKSKQDAEKASKVYADAQDNLKETNIKAYADGIVSDEEQRAIQDAKNKLEMAKTDAQSKANAAQTAAEEYAVIKANSAETNAKAYTDAYKHSNDVAMTKLETSISQNGDKIALKVDEQKFNASRKTLSQVISEISATTKGINLSYDENGNIQSYTMDRNGIKIDGSKIDINQGDVVIQNGVTKIKDAYIDYLFAKDAFIDKLKARDIDFNRATANGSSGSATLSIMGDRILQSGKFKRIWKGVTYDYDVSTIMREGYIKFADFNRNREISISAFGISTFVDGSGTQDGYEGSSGTISWWDKTYGSADGITMSSEVGVAALKSYQNRVVLDANSTVDVYSKTNAIHLNPLVYDYDGVNRFAFTIADSSTYGRVGYQMFGAGTDGIEYGSGLRFHKARNQPRVSVVDKNYATSSATILEAGIGEFENINTRYNTLFLNVSSIGEVRVQEKGSSNYRDIRFGKWYAMSSEKYKYDINEWNYSVLDAYRNDLKLYSYKYKGEKNSDYIRNHHGVIIERELPIEWRHGDGFDGNEVMFWNTKAIQELIEKVDKLEEQLNEQSITS
ncbi:phage tail spike protein [Staphylococcus hominis]|uniref:phage tail spike protein n=1 Tax=Staphylococcus hominis TaxID=1290 RepID=UPI003DA02026